MAVRKLLRARSEARSRAHPRPALKSGVKRAIRRRRTPEEAKVEALRSARNLLLREGPDAVTLQNVAAEIGMTHSNLLHHFGSAAELQSALMAMMVKDLTVALDDAVVHLKSDKGAPRALVDMVFDAFDKGGAARLAAWMVLSGNTRHLDAVARAIEDLVEAIEEKFALERGDPHLGVTSAVLFLALLAFGDALIGGPIKEMLDREKAAPRKIAAMLLPRFFDIRE